MIAEGGIKVDWTSKLGPMGVLAKDFDWAAHEARQAPLKAVKHTPVRPSAERRVRRPVEAQDASTGAVSGSGEAASVEPRNSVAAQLPREVTKFSRKMRRAAATVLKDQAPRTIEERSTPRPDGTIDDAGKWYPVCACSTVPHRAATAITAMQRSSGAVSWAGVMRCGSVWTCAECATKIEDVRSKELLRLIETARSRGLIILFITHTFPHEEQHSCAESMEGLSLSVRTMRQQRRYVQLRKSLGFVGLVRKREVTIGWGGFHPHDHELWVCDPLEATIDIEAMAVAPEPIKRAGRKPLYPKSELEKHVAGIVYPIWARVVGKVFGDGRVPSQEHGLDVKTVWNANDYLAKCPEQAAKKAAAGKLRWGTDAEMGKTTVKRGRRGSRTPWDVLDIASGNVPSFEEQKAAGHKFMSQTRAVEVFRDYARGTWRKRAMYWTPTITKKDGTVVEGLRDRFGLGDELTDEQIAAGELPMNEEQAQAEKEKTDPIMVSVDFDLYSLAALGRNYVDALQERAPQGSIVVLARLDGWRLERLEDGPEGRARWGATHPEARALGMKRGLIVEKVDPDEV